MLNPLHCTYAIQNIELFGLSWPNLDQNVELGKESEYIILVNPYTFIDLDWHFLYLWVGMLVPELWGKYFAHDISKVLVDKCTNFIKLATFCP